MQATMEVTAVGRNISIRTKRDPNLAGAASRSSLYRFYHLDMPCSGESQCRFELRAEERKALLMGGEVAPACPHLEIFLQRGDLDGPEAPVGFEICGMVGNHVLTAQFVFDGRERILDIL